MSRLSADVPDWEEQIADMNQVSAVEAHRIPDHVFSDDEIFRGLVLSVLSNSTNWDIVKKVLPELESIFYNFQLREYAALEHGQIEKLYSWFIERKAGSTVLRRGLLRLKDAALILIPIAERPDGLNGYFDEIVKNKGDVPSAAIALGSSQSKLKLPGLGIPLAAEFLKNIGHDVSKPDRHINRAMGSFGWVEFGRWSNREGTTPPIATQVELVSVMRAMEKFALALSLPVCFVDNAVWLLCAKSGVYLDNRGLSSLHAGLLN